MLFLLPPLPHPPPLFPYTTLFRSFRLLIYRKPFALQKLCDSPACRNDLNIRQIQFWKSDPHTIDGSPVMKDHTVRLSLLHLSARSIELLLCKGALSTDGEFRYTHLQLLQQARNLLRMLICCGIENISLC